jgi:hypothetical protein
MKDSLPQAHFQHTVSTILCDKIGDYVCLIVNNQWKAHCDWWKKAATGALKMKRNELKQFEEKKARCEKDSCTRVANYLNSLIEEARSRREVRASM